MNYADYADGFLGDVGVPAESGDVFRRFNEAKAQKEIDDAALAAPLGPPDLRPVESTSFWDTISESVQDAAERMAAVGREIMAEAKTEEARQNKFVKWAAIGAGVFLLLAVFRK